MTTTTTVTAGAREQTRARLPDTEGVVERDGVRLHYEVYGTGEPTILLLPTWSIVHSRHWKAQIPYLARHCRVVTFDGRGNGRSGPPGGRRRVRARRSSPPTRSPSWTPPRRERAIVVGLSAGAQWASLLAADHPERVSGAVFIGPAVWLSAAARRPHRGTPSTEPLDGDEGWTKDNLHYWLRDYRGFLEFFFAKLLHRAALHQADRGLRRLGARDDPRDAGRHPAGAAWTAARRRSATPTRASGAPCW